MGNHFILTHRNKTTTNWMHVKHLINAYPAKKICIFRYEYAFRAWLAAKLLTSCSVLQLPIIIDPANGCS